MLLTGCATPTLYDNPPTEKTSSVSLQAVGLKGHVVYVNDFLWVHVLDKSGSRIGSIKLTPGEPTDLIHIEQNREVVLNFNGGQSILGGLRSCEGDVPLVAKENSAYSIVYTITTQKCTIRVDVRVGDSPATLVSETSYSTRVWSVYNVGASAVGRSPQPPIVEPAECSSLHCRAAPLRTDGTSLIAPPGLPEEERFKNVKECNAEAYAMAKSGQLPTAEQKQPLRGRSTIKFYYRAINRSGNIINSPPRPVINDERTPNMWLAPVESVPLVPRTDSSEIYGPSEVTDWYVLCFLSRGYTWPEPSPQDDHR